ncbi:peptidylprolyl isomerase [Treponema sp. R6D11]
MKRIIFLLLGLFIVLPCFAQSNLQSAATVNLTKTEAITVGQLRTEVQRMEKASGKPLSKSERLQVLDVIINERLVIQAAERDRIMVTENEINQQMDQLKNVLAQQLGRKPTDAEFAQAVMNESGLEVAPFKEQLRRQLIVQKYLMAKKGDLINSVKMPTDQDIQNEYTLLKGELTRPETIRCSMIQVAYGSDAASRAKAKTLAESLVKEINNDPAKFDEVAQRSVAPNSGYQAGDAGYLPRNQEARNLVGQTFMDTAFSLKQGQVSKLIEGQQGYQIIKVTENYASKQLELSDVLQFGTRITVRDYIGQGLLNQRQQAVLKQASEEIVKDLRSGKTFTVFENNINW